MSAAAPARRGPLEGVLWTLFAMGGARLITLAGLAVLARLLAPEDFGLVAFGLVYVTYATTVGDLGTGAALIYWPNRREEAAQVTFAANVVVGIAWLLVTWLAADAVAAFFRSPSGGPILVALAWTFPIQALGATHEALCRKSLRFRAWFVPETGFAGVKAAVAIAFALAGFGAWSLVWGQLAGQAARTALFWTVVPWRPARRMPWDLVRPMCGYGAHIVVLNVLSAIVHHADLLIVGRFFGAAALGLYQMAAKLPEMSITLVVRAVSHVLFPTLSTLAVSGRSAKDTYLLSLGGVALVAVPGAVVLVVLAEPLVATAFGPAWLPASPVVQALAICGCLRALGSNAGDLLKASGRPGALAALAVVKAVLLVPVLIWAGQRTDMTGVALASAAVAAVTASMSLVVACRISRTPVADVLGALRPGMIAGFMVAAVLAVWMPLVSALPALARLVSAFGVASLAGLAAVRMTSPAIWAVLVQSRRLAARGGRPDLAEAGTP
jgi:PST family polysaccharide transporter